MRAAIAWMSSTPMFEACMGCRLFDLATDPDAATGKTSSSLMALRAFLQPLDFRKLQQNGLGVDWQTLCRG